MRRRGFSLVEVVVVFAVVATLIGLLMPAIRNAREGARRAQCANNLKQVGLAIQNYLNDHETFPPGVVDDAGPVPNTPDGLRIGWAAQILPFMDHQHLYDAIDFDVPVADPDNRTAVTTRLGSFRCPSDPGKRVPGGLGITGYAGCHHDAEAPIDADNHGVFFLNSAVGPRDVTDGLSYTVLVGEKRVVDGDLGWASGTAATLRNTGHPINADPAATTVGDPLLHVGGFSSFHPGGAHFLFGDGSVRFLSERVGADVLRRLGHRSDGDLIGADELRPPRDRPGQAGNR